MSNQRFLSARRISAELPYALSGRSLDFSPGIFPLPSVVVEVATSEMDVPPPYLKAEEAVIAPATDPIPLLAAWRDQLPPWAHDYQILGVPIDNWIGLAGLAVIALVLGIVGQRIVVSGILAVVSRTRFQWDDHLARILPWPMSIVLAVFAFAAAAPLLDLSPTATEGVEVAARTLLIFVGTAFALRLVTVSGVVLERYLTEGITDENRQRSVKTQVAVPRGILRVVVVVIGVALILLQFDVVRSIGISLLASAGIAGIVIGLAAQKTVGNLLAGIQIAIFQPLRIGDAVVIEGEWGLVEEIGLSHVVVKIWDERRLVLPVGYILEKPFQNWTRGSSDLLGTVLLYADYTVPVDDLRAELVSVLKQTPLWDQRVQGVQVTNLTTDAVEVRVLVSAADGGKLWDLRCHVREKLLAWLQSTERSHLPVDRVKLQAPTGEAERAAG